MKRVRIESTLRCGSASKEQCINVFYVLHRVYKNRSYYGHTDHVHIFIH